MKRENTNLDEIKLVGIEGRTSTAAEMNPQTAIIGQTVQRFFHQGLMNNIPDRKSAGKTFCVYTNYESDLNGAYTYFIGEEVSTFDNVDQNEFATLTIPAQSYAKFTSEPGQMPYVCINMWQHIWQMTDAELGGTRPYTADFEVYDERSVDPNNAVLDIYIALK